MNALQLVNHETVLIDDIRTDGGTQPRSAIYQNVVDDYAEAISSGAIFPPVVLFYDGSDYWLADGFHRHAGHRKAGLTKIAADIRQGARRDAVLYSVGANSAHGLRRTNEDKRRAVMTLLQDAEWAKWSDREIARRAGVSDKTVGALRKELSAEVPQIERTVERNGVTYLQNTANIGRPAVSQPIEVRASSEPAPEHNEPIRMQELEIRQADNDNDPSTRLSSFSGDNEWYTPARYVDMAREVMGTIDTDPASNPTAQRTVRATTYYTAETNGLDKDWHGKVWMNPPYSNPEVQQFAEKVIAEYRSGRVTEAIVLTNNSADTGWHRSMQDACTRYCTTTGRIKFESPTREGNSPAMGQSFFYFGNKPDRFKEIFSRIGNVWIKA